MTVYQYVVVTLAVSLGAQAQAASISPLTGDAVTGFAAPMDTPGNSVGVDLRLRSPGDDPAESFLDGPLLGQNPIRAILPPDPWGRPAGETPNVLTHGR